MAKEINAIISDKMVSEVVKTIKEVSEKAIESSERMSMEKAVMEIENERREKEKFKEQEDMMKTEFERVYNKLKKETPGTKEYHELLDNLNDIKRIIKGGY